MFLESFRITGSAVLQIIILGAIGYFLVKKKVLGGDGLDALSRLTIDITLPILIFCQLIKDFSFKLYPNWWVFPLISLAITILGLLVGFLFSAYPRPERPISGNRPNCLASCSSAHNPSIFQTAPLDAVQRTPAVAEGLTDRIWTIQELPNFRIPLL